MRHSTYYPVTHSGISYCPSPKVLPEIFGRGAYNFSGNSCSISDQNVLMFRRFFFRPDSNIDTHCFTHLTLVQIQNLSNACLATSGFCSRKHLKRDSNFQILIEKTESVLFKNQPNSRPKNKMYPVLTNGQNIFNISDKQKKNIPFGDAYISI